MKSFNYSGNNLEGCPKCESDKLISRQWSFKYYFACIHVESWGSPFLVLASNSYSDWGESWGYSYEKTGISFTTVNECQEAAKQLNQQYNFPRYFNFSIQVKNLELNNCPVS